MVNTAQQYQDSKLEVQKEDILTISGKIGEPLGLTQNRLEALTHYQKHPLPTGITTKWKGQTAQNYLPINVGELDLLRAAQISNTDQSNAIVLQPGGQIALPQNFSSEMAGVTVLPLSAVESAKSLIGSASKPTDGFFEALNQAVWTRGIYIHVAQNVKIPKPLLLKIIADETLPFSRVLIHLEQNASLGLLEWHESVPAGEGLHNVTCETILDRDAVLEQAVYQNLSAKTYFYYTHRGLLKQSANYKSSVVNHGSAHAKWDLGTIFQGDHARSQINGFVNIARRQQCNVNVAHYHHRPNCYSDVKYRSVCAGRAKAQYTGLIKVADNAKLTEAYQEAKNFLFADHAKASAIPELEILNNDVICTHGAATGTVDETQLFYLMSRGLSRKAAMDLIIHGLLMEVLDHLPNLLRSPIEAAMIKVGKETKQ